MKTTRKCQKSKNGFINKTKFATLIYGVSFSTLAISQDVITYKSGDEKKVKVFEISPSEVKYKSFDNIDGPIYTDQKSSIFMIKYENGQKDVFKELTKENPAKADVLQPESKEILEHNYYNNDPVSYGNFDLIIKPNGDSIRCNIEKITNTSISYLITRHGIDTRSTMPLSNVSRYINSNPKERIKEVVTITDQPVHFQKTTEANIAEGNTTDEDEFLPEARRYGGPRMGATLVGPGVFRDALIAEGKNNLFSQFGWQFEKRLFTTKTGISAVVEFVPLIGGIDMGKFIPSASALIGIRTKKGIEFGAGPNASIYGYKDAKGNYTTTNSFGVVIAAGMSMKSDKVYFPINIAFIPSVGKVAKYKDPQTGKEISQKYQTGAKVSLLIGFNYRKK